MVDRFRRRPNPRDRGVLERELAREKRSRHEEVVSSPVGLGVLLVLAITLTFVFRLDDIWFHQRPTWWIQLAESLAFFAAVATIGVVVGLPASWYAFQVAPDRMFFLDDLTASLVDDDDTFPNSSEDLDEEQPGRLDDLIAAAV
jgi:hypothetical protein